MSHHYSGPNIGFPRGDARLDLTDLYAFPKPGDAGKSIFIMNVHPSVGLNPPGPTTAEPFAPAARYELKIDTDGDAIANISYEVRFSSFEGGQQSATLRLAEGAQAAETGAGGKVIVEGVPVSTGHEGQVTQAGDHRFFAGWRSDPFFFDVLGTLNKFQFTSGDFFADCRWRIPSFLASRGFTLQTSPQAITDGSPLRAACAGLTPHAAIGV